MDVHAGKIRIGLPSTTMAEMPVPYKWLVVGSVLPLTGKAEGEELVCTLYESTRS